MVGEWRAIQLKEVCSKIGSGATPRGGKSVYLSEGEFALIRSQNVRNESFEYRGLAFIEKHQAEKLSNVALEENDVLLNITGDSVARSCQVDPNVLPARVNQHVAIIRPKSTILDAQYLRYYLVSPKMQQKMLSLSAIGSTRNALTKEMIEGFEILLPSLPVHGAIANIIGSLDDKIEMNQQMNETLEGMAQAIFKSWFVDFDPVIDNALKAGNSIPEKLAERAEFRRKELDDGTANREVAKQFPSTFQFTEEMGLIPESWEVKRADEIAKITIGKTPPRKEPRWFSDIRSDNIVWVSIRDMGSFGTFIGDSSEYLTPDSVEKFNVRVIPRGSVILSFKLTVGRVSIAQKEITTNEAIAHFVNPKFELTKEFLYCYLSVFDFYSLGSTSSIAIAINSKIVKGMPFIVPNNSSLEEFNRTTSTLFESINNNINQTESLTKLRDTLLPKLISGELRVPDVEKLVEEVL